MSQGFFTFCCMQFAINIIHCPKSIHNNVLSMHDDDDYVESIECARKKKKNSQFIHIYTHLSFFHFVSSHVLAYKEANIMITMMMGNGDKKHVKCQATFTHIDTWFNEQRAYNVILGCIYLKIYYRIFMAKHLGLNGMWNER